MKLLINGNVGDRVTHAAPLSNVELESELRTARAWRARLSVVQDSVVDPRLVSFAGIPVFIDRPKGFVQRGVSDTGVEWERVYQTDYGFIPGTLGGDGEQLDVFLGQNERAKSAYWADQRKADGARDELKLGLGFSSTEEYKACYVAHIPEKYLAGIVEAPVETVRALVGVRPWSTDGLSLRGGSLTVVQDIAALASSTRRARLSVSRSELGPAISTQRYLDKVVDAGLESAPGTLKRTLALVMGAVESAKSYADVERALRDLAASDQIHSRDYESLVEGAILLGIGAGAFAVAEEAE